METKDIIENCWLRTYTGKVIDPTDPKEDDIELKDIAWALSNQCRYGGHCSTFYNVATHCLFVTQLAHIDGIRDPELLLRCLLHDASEAYINDIPTPFKNLLPQYRDLEDKIMQVILEKFKIYDESRHNFLTNLVKKYDKQALVHEMNHLLVRIHP